jgi:hypothetical protein
MCREQVGSLELGTRAALKRATSSADRLTLLVAELLDAGSVETGRAGYLNPITLYYITGRRYRHLPMIGSSYGVCWLPRPASSDGEKAERSLSY